MQGVVRVACPEAVQQPKGPLQLLMALPLTPATTPMLRLTMFMPVAMA